MRSLLAGFGHGGQQYVPANLAQQAVVFAHDGHRVLGLGGDGDHVGKERLGRRRLGAIHGRPVARGGPLRGQRG